MKSRMRYLMFLVNLVASFALGQSDFSIRLINGYATVKTNAQQKYVQVGWQTTIEKGFDHFILQRSLAGMELSTDTSSWHDIARIDTIAKGDTIKTYIYSDYPQSAASYGYRVKILLNDTPRVYIEFAAIPAWALTGVSAMNQEIPTKYECISNYPNPFNPTTTMVLTLQKMEQGSLDIYDVWGRKLETLAEGSLPSGTHRYQWDGSKYSSGIYFCVLQTRSQTTTAKLVLQK
jgi:hypothetical protein